MVALMLCKRAGICLPSPSLSSPTLSWAVAVTAALLPLHHIWQQFFNSPLLTHLVAAVALRGEKTSQNRYVSGAHLVSKRGKLLFSPEKGIIPAFKLGRSKHTRTLWT